MADFRVQRTDYFDRLLKELRKRYRRIDKDIDAFLDAINDIKDLGIPLGNNLYKARIRNSDAVKGKSGGYR